MKITEIGLTSRAQRILWAAGITTVDALCERTPLELSMHRGFGVGCLRNVEAALSAKARKEWPDPREVLLRRIIKAWDNEDRQMAALIDEARRPESRPPLAPFWDLDEPARPPVEFETVDLPTEPANEAAPPSQRGTP